MPTREQYEQHSNLAAMDYLATLIYITGSLWSMQRSYENWKIMGAGTAGNKILKICRAAIEDLAEAATKKHPQEALERARNSHVAALSKATKYSLELAKGEQARLGNSDGVMTQDVHRLLLELVQEWGGRTAKIDERA